MAKLVIGLVGEKGGGKGSFFAVLKEILPDRKIEKVSSSDLLANTLNLWSIPKERENFIKLVATMNQGFGERTVTNALYNMVQNSQAEIVIIDSIRLQSDYDMLRKFPNSTLLYITADSKIRYDRTRSRGEKTGESDATFEEFMKQEEAHTEKLIPRFGSKSDYTINNNGSFEQFKKNVKSFADYLNNL